MWRAWGTFLILFSQDLGAPFASEDHEMTVRPPAGWERRTLSGQLIARFQPPGLDLVLVDGEKRLPPWGITVSHLHHLTKPKPLENLLKQVREKIASEYKGSKIVEEKPLKIGGRAAYRIAFEFENTLQIKTVLHRTNIESYLLDISFLKADEAKFRKAAEASLDTFQIIPAPLSGEEIAADARTAAFLREAKVPAGLLGEQWHSVYLVEKKVGHMRTKATESGGIVSFETDVQTDYGAGNVDTTTVRGSFSTDGRFQKVETGNLKTSEKKERWEVRASVTIEGGRLKAVRDMEGVKEEKGFPVEGGVLLMDVADFVRRMLVEAPKGAHLLKTISPYSDEWGSEMIEVNGKETLELDGKRREALIFFSRLDRRRHLTYYVAPDGGLVRQGGVRDVFSIRASTKEEALGANGNK